MLLRHKSPHHSGRLLKHTLVYIVPFDIPNATNKHIWPQLLQAATNTINHGLYWVGSPDRYISFQWKTKTRHVPIEDLIIVSPMLEQCHSCRGSKSIFISQSTRKVINGILRASSSGHKKRKRVAVKSNAYLTSNKGGLKGNKLRRRHQWRHRHGDLKGF